MYSYLTILLSSALFPLIFSFEKRVFYFSKWSKVLRAATLVAIPFLIWDAWFTSIGVWGFNERFTLGIEAFGLPIEEILFFILIPFSILIFWEISLHFKFYKIFKNHKVFFKSLNLISILLLIFNLNNIYTFIVMLFVLLTNYLVSKKSITFQKNIVFIFFISFIPFVIVNGLLTSLPIVWYDVSEKSNIMIGTIPLEDLFFSYSLLSLNALTYSFLKIQKSFV